MVEKPIIRKMRKSDIGRVLEIERESFITPWSRSLFLEEFEREYSYRYVICHEVTGDVLGFILFWVLLDECHVLNVAVTPAMRKQGMGARLMRECENMAVKQGASYIYLEVREGNLAAKSLYRKLGFRFIGIRKGYYSDTDEDGWVMIKNLKRKGR